MDSATEYTTSGAVADATVHVPLIRWDDFTTSMTWRQGEHVALIGPTGSGKTNLAYWLLPHRKYIAVFATKPRDESLVKFARAHGFLTMPSWENRNVLRYPRRLIWPRDRDLDTLAGRQRTVFTTALKVMYTQGGWCIYIDELWWLCHVLGMTQQVKIFLQQARSMNLSVVVATQRPAWVPLEVYDQATHLFLWRDTDETNLKRLAGISWINGKVIAHTIARLPQFHTLYVNTRTGRLAITRPPDPSTVGEKKV